MKVHHIGIETNNIEKSMRFYEQLGFQMKDRMVLMGEELYFLTLGTFTLELIVQKTETAAANPHLCLEVTDLKEQADVVQNGKVIEGPLSFENGWKTLFVEGPSGEIIELVQTKNTPSL